MVKTYFTIYEIWQQIMDDDESPSIFESAASKTEANKIFNRICREMKSKNYEGFVRLSEIQIEQKSKKWFALRLVDQKGWQHSKKLIKEQDFISK